MNLANSKYVNKVIDLYQKGFIESKKAKAYIYNKGITTNSIFISYKAGYADGSLLDILPDDGEIIDSLKKTGILMKNGHEYFKGFVVFPLYDINGNICGIYGFKTDNKQFKDKYLAFQDGGIFNCHTVKTHKEIILTDTILDALVFINTGIKNVIPVNEQKTGIASHASLFNQHGIETIFNCIKDKKIADTVATSLKAKCKGLQIVPVSLPGSINSFFSSNDNPKEKFMERLYPVKKGKTMPEKNEPETYMSTETGFILEIKDRKYEVKGLMKRNTNLKATVKGVSGKRFHVDTVDFYSARSRIFFVKCLCDLFGEKEDIITRDVERLLELSENYQLPNEHSDEKSKMTDLEKKRAMSFLKNPDMFEEILSDIETIGYTGEDTNKLLCYIAAVSRKMDGPLSVMIQSRSAAGKSYLQDTILSLIPEEDYIKYTRLTDQALFYKGSKSLSHKILAIEELDGMEGAIYSIRCIQSSKKITIAYTGKDSGTGKMKTDENTVEGPLMVFITTTQVEIDGETASRFVFISIDESEDMTRKILAKQRQSHTKQGMINKLQSEEIIKKHQNANRLLKPIHVFNPYADLLTFNSKSLRARRDHTKYLNLISAITYMFQFQRKVRTMEYNNQVIEYINVTLKDIEKANQIANQILGHSLDELTPPSKNLLKLIREMVTAGCKDKNISYEEFHFTRRDIREFSGWSDFQVKTHIKQLEELEYIYSVSGKKGKEYVYELLVTDEFEEDKPFLVGLAEIKNLRKEARKTGIQT